MINHENERLISLSQAAKRLPRRDDGQPVHRNTVARWARGGIAGVVLETLRVGRRRYTSIEACQRFFEALTRATTVSDKAITSEAIPADVRERLARRGFSVPN